MPTPRWRRVLAVACTLAGCLLLFRGLPSSPGPEQASAPAPLASAPTESRYVTSNIEDLGVGDTVLAVNPETGELENRQIVDAFRRTAYQLRVLTIRGPDGQQLPPIRTTDEHPFWVVEINDFVPAGELEVGDEFLAPEGELTTLVATEAEDRPEGVTVYNFEVEGAHTYFVLPGEVPSLHGGAVLVHNAAGGVCAGAKPPKARGARGTRNPKIKAAAARGRQRHREFAQKVKQRPGWQSEKTIKGPNGKTLRPDAIDPKGRPVELKPNTPSGRIQGARQMRRYMEATGTNGRIIYYDP